MKNYRRGFLQNCCAAGAISLTPNLFANAPRVAPSLGFSLYGMKKLPLREALGVCAKIGYSHVEFALNEGYETQPEKFASADRKVAIDDLATLKLTCPSLMVHFNLSADDKSQQSYLRQIQLAAELAQELDQRNPPMLETVLGGSPASWLQQRTLMSENLNRWAEAAANFNVSIAIKAHVRSAVNTPERLLWLVDQVKLPSILIAFDHSHFELQGIALQDSMSALVPKTKFIHVKDTSGDAEKFEFLLPGKGRTDYNQFFSLLRELNYLGPVCVEVSSQVFNKPEYDPRQAAAECFAALSNPMAKAYAA